MTLWLSVLVDMLHVSIPGNYDIGEILDTAWETLHFSDEFHDEGSAILLIAHPWVENPDSVVALASEEECMLIPPINFSAGWETHRVVCKEQDQLRNLMDRVGARGSAELISQRKRELTDLVRDIQMVPTHFIEGLTHRQVDILVASYEQGLYEIPARVKMEKVAKRTGLSRSTFGEHMQKGELQIMRNLYPILKARSDKAGGGRGSGGG